MLIQKQYIKLILLKFKKEEGATIFFIVEEAKGTVLDFSKGTGIVLRFYFVLL